VFCAVFLSRLHWRGTHSPWTGSLHWESCEGLPSRKKASSRWLDTWLLWGADNLLSRSQWSWKNYHHV